MVATLLTSTISACRSARPKTFGNPPYMDVWGSVRPFRVAVCRLLLVTLISLLLASVASAEPSLSTEISPRHGEQDDLFIFTVKITDAERISGRPRLLNELDFEATLLGPQTSISIVNGVVDSRVAYVYQLKAKRSGALKTPRVELEYGGKTLSAPELDVQVDDSGSSAQSPTTPSEAAASTSERLFIKQTATPLKVYQGQQVINSLSLYTRVELAEFNLQDFSTDGFWQERFIDNDRSTTEVKGLEYTRLEHAKALYPLAVGKLSLPARTATAKVVVRTRRQLPSFFDLGDNVLHDLFESVQLKEVKLSSDPLTVEVDPLPAPPAELEGLLGPVPIVGETSLRASYSSDPISAGEVKTIALELTTSGNVHPLKTIPLSPPDGVKVYEENPETSSVPTGAHVVMKRVFRFSLVPLRGGIVHIPPARIAYFDPARRQYLTASTAEISFPVNGDILKEDPSVASQSSTSQSPPAQSAGSLKPGPNALPTLPPVPVAPDIEYREPSLLQRFTEVVSVQLALLMAAATVAISTLILVFSRRVAQTRRSIVTPSVINKAGSPIELERTLRLFLCDKITAVKSDDPYELLRAHIRSSTSNLELAQATCSLIDQLEAARYGAASDAEALQRMKERFKDLSMQW